MRIFVKFTDSLEALFHFHSSLDMYIFLWNILDKILGRWLEVVYKSHPKSPDAKWNNNLEILLWKRNVKEI